MIVVHANIATSTHHKIAVVFRYAGTGLKRNSSQPNESASSDDDQRSVVRDVVVLNDGSVCASEIVLRRVAATSASGLALNRQARHGWRNGVIEV